MVIRSGLYHQLSTAYTNFKRNKIRTILTSLGIMIGVLSVVMLIALGLGLRNYIEDQFESMGTNLIAVFPGSSFASGGGIESVTTAFFGGVEFDEKDMENLEDIRLLEYVAPVYYRTTPVYFEKEEELGYILGTNEQIFSVLNTELEAGHLWSRSDVRRRSKRVVIGYVIAEELFGELEKAIGEKVEVLDYNFEIVGVAKKKGDQEMDNSLYMPYTTTFGSMNPDESFFTLYLGVKDEDDVERAKELVKEELLERYDEDEFSVVEQTEMLKVVDEIFSMINFVLVAIGSISLLVGGIGIMNIMYATVTERTKEIGIRRAIGATQKDVLYQFMTEAVVLSVFGGILGVLVSFGIVLLMQPFFPAAVSPLAVALALVVSSAIGIFFGVFPARRASQLPPIEAIRYE